METEQNREYLHAVYAINDNDKQPVWINWQDKVISEDDPESGSISSTEELAILLMASKPDESCTLTCLGYSFLQQDQTSLRPALIFKSPPDFDLQSPAESLLRAFATYEKPSLTHWVTLALKLAQGLLSLHSVNWLHKALRSSNILFFPSSDAATFDVQTPFIAGFDNSRRSRFKEATTEVPRAGHMEVYRHPGTQFDDSILAYRKTFDIYSLGLILAQIAIWQPLVKIMDIEKTVEESSLVTHCIQKLRLTSEPKLLSLVRAQVGEKYAGAVETCLKGRNAFGIKRRDQEISVDTGMKIQRGFNAKVARPLAEIIV
ncbi:hypothetical protein ACLMJK_009403 [Lecanora helva]